ncbi:sugar transferase [Allomuricauda sp. R78024]|uniref:sugar transferase n=1 Tax=Allomuricauda sp. R78024 TaxID=3093867 RepID=UPI0037CB81C8
MKRVLDILLSLLGIVFLLPLMLLIMLIIKLTSAGPLLYRQQRVGLNNKDFKILKFRTMYIGSDKKGLLTVGDRDPRVTRIGYVLRKSKLDELPQLFNVFFGEMSLVGPRPEVRKYVDFYTKDDLMVLEVKPGITDYASIHFRNENELLKDSENPDTKYIKEILPIKLKLNKEYIKRKSVFEDFKIIFKTFSSILNK